MDLHPNLLSSAVVLSAAVFILAGCNEPTATRTGTGGIGGGKVTAIYSRVSPDYVRERDANGNPLPETYVFKSGGNYGGPRFDITIDTLTFDDISKVIAPALATRNYVPGDDPSTTKLIIMVYWGTTVTPSDVDPKDGRESAELLTQAGSTAMTLSPSAPGSGRSAATAVEIQHTQSLIAQARAFSSMESIQDAQIDAASANILGYTDEIFRTKPGGPKDPNLKNLKYEIENDRYYVVLLAYDYQLGRRTMQRKLLWETRFSIPEPGNDFQKALPLMTSYAAAFFGEDSHGLIHHNLGVGHVEVGEPKSLGTVP
ncbi:MAG: hypothetical protein ABSF76_16695 [Opitutaceae bacterium]